MLKDSSGGNAWISIIIQVLRALIPLAALLIIKHYVDAVVGSDGLELSEWGPVIMLIGTLALALLADDLLLAWGNFIVRKQAILLERHVSTLIHKKAAVLSLRFYEDAGYHDMLSRAEQDISWRPYGIVNDLITIIRGMVSFIAMAYIIVKLSLLVLAVLIIAYIPVLIIRIKSSGRLYDVRKTTTQSSRQASYFSWLLTGERPAREVRLFNLSEFFEELYVKHLTHAREAELDTVKRNTNAEVFGIFIKVLIFTGLLVYISYSFFEKRISAGEMVMYLVAFRQASLYLRDSVSGVSGLYESRLFINDLFQFLDIEAVSQNTHNLQPVPDFNVIEVKNLTFTYPGSESPALKNVSLKICRGEKTAIVGPNGSGKTTLVKLLSRLYEPDEGKIELDGINIQNFKLEEYQRLFSIVFQDFMLYFLTASENIQLGDTASPADNERINNAAEKAGIASFLKNLPRGYDTMLGHHTEGGRELSWGEWQKIAIARALYREARILVLDEPSSSLDAESEYEIFSRLADVTSGRTSVMISHRMANVSKADRIIVLDRGMVSEAGTHEELMISGGRYSIMFNLQKSMYT